MTRRRAVLGAGFAFLVVSAAHRVGAAGPGEAEGTLYGGSTTGGWACGPRARLGYGGAGGEVRYRPSASDESHEGVYLSAAGAAEYQSFHPIDCAPCKDPLPPNGVLGAGRALLGGELRYVGFYAGPLVWSHYDDSSSHAPLYSVLPDLSLRFGEAEGARLVLGFGSYDAPTMLHPGAYAGFGVAPAPGWDVMLHTGFHFVFGDTVALRNQLLVGIPIAPHLQLHLAPSVSAWNDSLGGEMLLGIGGDL